jgi:hypothetical protein
MNFDRFVISGAMQKAVNKAVLEAAAIAKAQGLPEAGAAHKITLPKRDFLAVTKASQSFLSLPPALQDALIQPKFIKRSKD